MLRVVLHIVVCCAAGEGLLVPALSAQPSPQQSPQLIPRTPQQQEQNYEEHRRIQLNVRVTGSDGKPVKGLAPEDFTVFDRGQPQKIVSFREESGSSAAVRGLLVVDAINGDVGRVRKEIEKFFGQGTEPLPFPLSIVVLTPGKETSGRPSTDRRALLMDMAELTKNVRASDCDDRRPDSDIPGGRMNLLGTGQAPVIARADCVNWHFTTSLNALGKLAQEQRNVKARTIMIWLGAGWPLPREVCSGQIVPDCSHGNLGEIPVKLDEDLREGHVTFDAISWGGFEHASGLRRKSVDGDIGGASIPEQEAALELPALARQTGGQAFERSKNLTEAIDACLSDGDSFYTLAIDPAPAAAKAEFHSIEVKVGRPGVAVRTATGYYVEP